MHPALQGLLAGIALAVFFVMFEVLSANRSAAERAKKMAKKQEWNQDERARVQSNIRFAIILPFGVAFVWWLLSTYLK
jgi:hypothetical protein